MQTLQFSVAVSQWIALKAIGKFSRKAFYRGPLATVKLAEQASQVFKLPNNFSMEQGVLIEPLSVGLQALYGNPPEKGEQVLIIGGAWSAP